MMILRLPPCSRYTSFSSPSDKVSNVTRCANHDAPDDEKSDQLQLLGARRFCLCGRRHFVETGIAATAFFPVLPLKASNLYSDYEATVKRIHPPRPDWYEELYASVLDSWSIAYESEIAPYKSQIFSSLRRNAKTVLEIGIGTGPNLKYYANDTEIEILGIDPNTKMESYALKAAIAAGLPPGSFKFRQGVGEAIPLNDSSVDAVVATLVLCSVKDVDQTIKEIKRVLKPNGIYAFVEHVAAKDGTILRLVQGVLDPLQQAVADGCHLTRQTGVKISEAGFSSVEMNTAFLSTTSIINPQLYGVATK